jgi:hypothetical protein
LRAVQRARPWCECEDYVRSCANQLGRRCIQSRPTESTAIDLKISTLNKATGSEFLNESSVAMGIVRNPIISQNSDAAASPGFLRASDRKRWDCGRHANKSDELAPLHVVVSETWKAN